MRTLLFDVNVLLALADEHHQNHDRIRDWLGANDARRWSTCPITENGFVRIVSQPAYPGTLTATQAIHELRKMTSDPDHVFWPDAVSIRNGEIVDPHGLTSHRHVTDIYLLALAVSRDGALLTFDARVPAGAVARDARRYLIVVE